jgi:TatD DNase family protein
MLIDTHAHVNFAAFKDDAEDAIKRALDSGIRVINVGTQVDTSKQAIEMANKFRAGVFAVIGIHPVHTYSQELDEEETHFKTREEKFDHDLYYHLAQDPKVVGIGECGLDYFRLPLDGNQAEAKKLQAQAFTQQVLLAKELDKTLVIHFPFQQGY